MKIGLIFEKPSTRTRVSFDVGISSMGGSSIYLGPQDIELGKREEVRDVARTLDRYLSGVVLRTFSHEVILEFAKYFTGPIVNGLSDQAHPCQALADYFTIFERGVNFKNSQVSYVGDGNNVLQSLLVLAAKLGGKISYATPNNHQPCAKIIAETLEIAKQTGAQINKFEDPRDAVKDADFVYTDVWVSMGQEKSRDKKLRDFSGMQVNAELLSHAKKGVCVMHCLPAHRGEEITDDVLESKGGASGRTFESIVFEQAENRLHVQKAILAYLFS